MARVKLHNPHLLAVNPFGKKTATRKRRKTNPARKTTARGKKRNPSRTRNPFDAIGILKKGGAAGLGALGVKFAANILPMPTNPLFNAGTKAGIGVLLGWVAKSFGPFKAEADYVMAGGVGVAVGEGLGFVIPKLRTVIVPTQTEAAAIKQIAPGELNDVVVVDEGFSDVVDSMNYDSAWANQ